MTTVLVTGARGQLGKEIQYISKHYDAFKFVFTDVEKLDICDIASVEDFFAMHKPSICINAAAYTAVDTAEKDKLVSYDINVMGVNNLSKTSQKYGVKLIHVSTDFVFDGKQNTPYKEHDNTEPLGVYGKTKLLGELEALNHNPQTIIIRTAWLYSSFGNNFVKTMLRLGKERGELSVVFDQVGNPTYAHDLAKVILKIMETLRTYNPLSSPIWGVYHYANEGAVSWYDFAAAIFELAKLPVVLHPIRSWQYPTPAQRPAYSVFDKQKIKETFDLTIPYWRNSLKGCLDVMNKTEYDV